MKNKIRIISAFLLAGMLALSGCSNPLAEPAPEASGKTGIALHIGAAGQDRSVGPEFSDFSSFKLELSNNHGNLVTTEELTSPDYTLEIGEGTWSLTVTAYKDTYAVATQTVSNIVVNAGAFSDVNVILEPIEGLSGGLNISAISMDTALRNRVNTAKLTISDWDGGSWNSLRVYDFKNTIATPGSNEIIIDPATTATTPISLPTGSYKVDVEITSSETVGGVPLKIYRSEMVYIYPYITTDISKDGSTSGASYAFTGEDFTSYLYFSGSGTVSSTAASQRYLVDEVKIDIDGSGHWVSTKDKDVVDSGVTSELTNQTPTDTDLGEYTYSWSIEVASRFFADTVPNITTGYKNVDVVLSGGIGGAATPLTKSYTSSDAININKQGALSEFMPSVINVYSITNPTLPTGTTVVADTPDEIDGNQVAITVTLPASSFLVPNGLTYTDNQGTPQEVSGVNAGALVPYTFTMPNKDTAISADIYTLAGKITLAGDGADEYEVATVTAASSSGITTSTDATGSGTDWTFTPSTEVMSNPSPLDLTIYVQRVGTSTPYAFTRTVDISDAPWLVDDIEVYAITAPATIGVQPHGIEDEEVELTVTLPASSFLLPNGLTYTDRQGTSEVSGVSAGALIPYTFTMPDMDTTISADIRALAGKITLTGAAAADWEITTVKATPFSSELTATATGSNYAFTVPTSNKVSNVSTVDLTISVNYIGSASSSHSPVQNGVSIGSTGWADIEIDTNGW